MGDTVRETWRGRVCVGAHTTSTSHEYTERGAHMMVASTASVAYTARPSPV